MLFIGRIYANPDRTRVSVGTGGMSWLTLLSLFVAAAPYGGPRGSEFLWGLWAVIAGLAGLSGVIAFAFWFSLGAHEKPRWRPIFLGVLGLLLTLGPLVPEALWLLDDTLNG